MHDITITITRTASGEVRINGPVQDQIFMFGLLEVAKGLVAEWHRKQAESPLVKPPVALLVPKN